MKGVIVGPLPHPCGQLVWYGRGNGSARKFRDSHGRLHHCPDPDVPLPPRVDVLPRGGEPVPVGEVLGHYCPCGGDALAQYHDQSLLHLTWRRKILPVP